MSPPLARPVPTPFAPLGRRTMPLLFALAIAALLQSTVLLAINPAFAGWYPDHGHVYRDGLPVAHDHPWDTHTHDHASEQPWCGGAGGENGQVAFTPSPDGVEGTTVSLPLLGAPFALPCAPVPAPAGTRATASGVGAGIHLGVPTPPPRP